MNNNGYNFNILNNELTVTASFLKKASVLNSNEYRILKQFRAENPELTIVEKKSNNKGQRNPISFKQMYEFIQQCRDADERMVTFEKVKALSKIQRSPYKYVKDWFLDNYANYSEQPEFDENGFVIVKTKSDLDAEKCSVKIETIEKTAAA